MSDDRDRIARAEVLLDAGRAREAGQLAGEHLTNHPGDLNALSVLARARLELGEVDEAVADAQQAITAHPEAPQAWLLLSPVCSAAGLHSRAVDAARRAVELAPEFWATHLTLSSALVQRGWVQDRREAIAAAQEATRIVPDEPAALSGLGDALRFADREDESREVYEKALRLHPDHDSARFGITALSPDPQNRNLFADLLGEHPDDDMYSVVHTVAVALMVMRLGYIGLAGTALCWVVFLIGDSGHVFSVLLVVGLTVFFSVLTLVVLNRQRWLHLPTITREFKPLLVWLVASPLGLVTAAVLALLPIDAFDAAVILTPFLVAGIVLARWSYVDVRRIQRAYDATHPDRSGAHYAPADSQDPVGLERELDQLDGEIHKRTRIVAGIRYTLLVGGVIFGLLPLAFLARPNGYWLTIICYAAFLVAVVIAEVNAARRRRLRARRAEVAALLGRPPLPAPTARQEMRAFGDDSAAHQKEIKARMKQEEQEKKRLKKLQRLERRR